MKPSRQNIADVVFSSIDELNEMLGSNHRLEKSLQSRILGQPNGLDSLGFINLVTLIEEKYFERFGSRIVLTQTSDKRLEGQAFESIGSLVEFIDSSGPS
jgi:acyl carrier protein